MHRKLKKLWSILFITVLAITSCQKDDTYMHHSNVESKGFSRTISYEELKTMPKAIAMIEEISEERRKKSVYNEKYDFTIDTTNIELFEIGDYHSLTFNVFRDSTSNSTAIENLILNWEPYEDYKSFLTTYNLTESEVDKIKNDEKIDLSGKEILTHLTKFDTRTILKSGGNPPNLVQIDGSCYIITYVRTVSYSDIPGQLEASVWEEVLEPTPCPEENTNYTYTLDPNAGGLYIPILNIPNPEPYIPIPGVTGGGGKNVGSPFNPVITKPKVMMASKKECEKIEDALSAGNYMENVTALASLINDPYEFGSGLDSNGNVTLFQTGPDIIIIPPPVGTTYTVVSHTHDSGKLSIFSFSDLEAIAKLLKNEQIDTSTFIATLSTHKGTHYVLTISNTTKFKDFFYHKFHYLHELDLQYHLKYENSHEKAYNLKKKYYDSKNRLLNENNVNNEMVLEIFLNFLKEADIGVSLFETDENFETFTQVQVNRKGEIKRSTCN